VNSFELERFVDRHLRMLPAPSAPSTLLPRVLAAARAWSTRPWYTREWFTWPLGWQLGSVLLLLLTFSGAIVALPMLSFVITDSMSSLVDAIAIDLPRVWSGIQVSANLLRLLWRVVVQPVLPYAFVVVALMSAACGAVVAALNRIMFGKVLQS
jgi:hypothetical protein